MHVHACVLVCACGRGSQWTVMMRQLWGPKALFASCKSRACRAVTCAHALTHTQTLLPASNTTLYFSAAWPQQQLGPSRNTCSRRNRNTSRTIGSSSFQLAHILSFCFFLTFHSLFPFSFLLCFFQEKALKKYWVWWKEMSPWVRMDPKARTHT